jgi:hypothetical protein
MSKEPNSGTSPLARDAVSHPLTKAAAMLRPAGGHDTSGPPSRGERPIGHAITMRPRALRRCGSAEPSNISTAPSPSASASTVQAPRGTVVVLLRAMPDRNHRVLMTLALSGAVPSLDLSDYGTPVAQASGTARFDLSSARKSLAVC